MIQLKCAELLFLIGFVTCCAADYSSGNNQPFLVDRINDSVDADEIIGNVGSNNDDRFIFATMRC